MVIWLASHPRSGADIFRTVAYHLWGIRSFNAEHPPGVPEDYPAALTGSWNAEGDLAQAQIQFGQSPVLFLIKTHRLPPNGEPAVVMERDGRCSTLSYWKYWTALKPGHGLSLAQFICGLEAYGSWSRYVMECRKKVRAPRLYVRYEDLLEGGEATLQRIQDFLKQWSCPDRLKDWPQMIADIRSIEPSFWGKRRVLKWSGHPSWTEKEDRLFHEHHRKALALLGYA